ncbi:hypothetical protein [Alicyclobacillus shizuokensis]|uniref:hypothetical protein n=1 Tax=Alicyclobacillus shizuokensis TaxID=392014 RepID=UPI000832354E|nr:hypothetical protein [Alicyclobacillus shizuokensis]MCL6626570.1 hypothetical protein [Alicyclobacillus shizuokensis]
MKALLFASGHGTRLHTHRGSLAKPVAPGVHRTGPHSHFRQRMNQGIGRCTRAAYQGLRVPAAEPLAHAAVGRGGEAVRV